MYVHEVITYHTYYKHFGVKTLIYLFKLSYAEYRSVRIGSTYLYLGSVGQTYTARRGLNIFSIRRIYFIGSPYLILNVRERRKCKE